MNRVLGLALVAAAATGCSHPLPGEPPTIRGNIVAAADSRLLVVAPGGDYSCDIAQRLQVGVARTAVLRRSGAAATPSDLVVGTPVSVWISGPVLESCPGQVGAKVVVIEDRGS